MYRNDFVLLELYFNVLFHFVFPSFLWFAFSFIIVILKKSKIYLNDLFEKLDVHVCACFNFKQIFGWYDMASGFSFQKLFFDWGNYLKNFWDNSIWFVKISPKKLKDNFIKTPVPLLFFNIVGQDSFLWWFGCNLKTHQHRLKGEGEKFCNKCLSQYIL